MFKKLSVFFLLCASVAMVSACSDSASDSIVFVSPTIEGTYDVTYFGTVADVGFFNLVITDSCSKSKELKVIDINNPLQSCSQTSAMTGKILVTKGDNGTLKITSKIQMAGGFVEFAATDKFQYTEYYPVVPAANRLSGIGVGMKGYNLDASTGELSTIPVEFATSPFEFYLTGSELIIKMTLKGKEAMEMVIDAPTVVVAKKISDDVTRLDNKRFWNFEVDNATKGMYDITLFASEIEGKVITNDCGLAIANGFANIYNCSVAIQQATKFQGKLAVDKDASSTFNMAQIYAKVQMNGNSVENTPTDKYMYFNYAMLPGTMSAKGIMGVTYFDNVTKLPSNNPVAYPEATFKVKMSDNKSEMTIETVIKDREITVDGIAKKVDMKTIIKATKTAEPVTDLPDELFYSF